MNENAAIEINEIAVEEPAKGRRRFSFLASFGHEAALAVFLVVVLVAAKMTAPDFLAVPTQIDLLSHVWELALLAVPMTLIIITGGIDLSVGSLMALSAVVLGLSYEAGMPPFVGAGLAVTTGALAGALNGFFIARMRVHPLIVTLATLAAFRGIAEGISLARPISGFPDSFTIISLGNIAGLPIPGVIFAVAAVAATLLLTRTVWGVWLYAMGHNETAALFSAIPVARLKLMLYTLSGSSAALAAVLFVARRNTAKADVGTGMELDVITAVVLGGTSIFGGRGSMLGTLLGVLLIHETREFVDWHWQRSELNFIVIGTLLIFSVLLNSFLAPRERD